MVVVLDRKVNLIASEEREQPGEIVVHIHEPAAFRIDEHPAFHSVRNCQDVILRRYHSVSVYGP